MCQRVKYSEFIHFSQEIRKENISIKENTFYSTYITLLIGFAVCWFELKVDSNKKKSRH